MLNAVSAYAPHGRCVREEKKAFRVDLDETVEKILKNEYNCGGIRPEWAHRRRE